MTFSIDRTSALVLVDVQRGFDDPAWGRRDNPLADANIQALLAVWTRRGAPVVLVRHDSADPASPLAAGTAGNELKPYLDVEPALLVCKTVNSAFLGEPDLDAWLRSAGVRTVVIAGITTNHCCETTARFAGNLGYETLFAIEATHTFDRRAPDGTLVPAEELSRMTSLNLHGEFATVVSTAQLVRGGRAIVRQARVPVRSGHGPESASTASRSTIRNVAADDVPAARTIAVDTGLLEPGELGGFDERLAGYLDGTLEDHEWIALEHGDTVSGAAYLRT